MAFRTDDFLPTPSSIPPPDSVLRMRRPIGTPVHLHPLNPLGFLLRAAQIYPDKVAIVHPNIARPVAYTYAVWTQRCQNLAYALIQAGISPGDRVAVLAPNSPMPLDIYFGGLAARAIVTAINIRLTAPEISYILEHSAAKLVLVDHQFTHLIPRDIKARVVVCGDTGQDGEGDEYEAFLSAGRRYSGEKGWMGLEVEGNEDASAILCYTSGTTGRPKGVITTLRGTYLAAIANAFEGRMNKDSTYLWILPMFHAGGWTFPYANVFSICTQITLRTIDYPLIWSHFLHSGVTHYCGAPTVQIGIVHDPKARKVPRQITGFVAGSAPTADLIGKMEAKGIEPVQVYGLTETYGPFTRCYPHPSWSHLPLEERAKLMARQGQSFATALDVRVVYPLPEDLDSDADPELVDVPWDGKTVGEIVTRGNIVMKEYFRDLEATRKAFRGGHFHSGDLAVMDPDGTVKIIDRSKDLIISGGENASSVAIEQELASHPHVLEVSVVAKPHAKWGERPMAFVILHPQHKQKWAGRHDVFERELKAHGRKTLPGFACPEWVVVVEEFPKTSTGKILKVNLRQIAAKL